jgi:Holliday junction resolvase RusA-like endonuclease
MRMPIEIVTFAGHIVPKARPRLDPKRGRGYTEPRYRDWLDTAIQQVAMQCTRSSEHTGPLRVDTVIGKDGTTVILTESELQRPTGVQGDIDNISGSLLDALQQGGAIANDKLVVALSAQFERRE